VVEEQYMRQEFEKILGEELRYLAITTRDRLELTQKEMGEKLEMGIGSYSDVETGETICISALSLVLLLGLQEDPRDFLALVLQKFAKQRDEELQPMT